jgi:hypothetical protein
MVRRVLTRHFIDQAIANDAFGRASDARRWAPAAVGLLGLLGGVAAIALLPDAPVTSGLASAEAVRAFSHPDRLMAIVAAMVSSGPDRAAEQPAPIARRGALSVTMG